MRVDFKIICIVNLTQHFVVVVREVFVERQVTCGTMRRVLDLGWIVDLVAICTTLTTHESAGLFVRLARYEK